MRILLVPEVGHRGRHMKIKSQQKQTLVYITCVFLQNRRIFFSLHQDHVLKCAPSVFLIEEHVENSIRCQR